jgi:integrase
MMKEANAGRSNRLTLEVFIDEYWYPKTMKTVRDVTMVGYNRDIKLRIRPYLGKVCLHELDNRHIQAMIDKCPTAKTGHNARDTLSAILGYAVKRGMLPRNPARDDFIYAEKGVERPLGAVITDFNEHLRVINLADDYEVKAILVLGFMFALRKGEILAVDWDKNVDWKNRILHIRNTYTRGKGAPKITAPKTPKSMRDLPISDHAYELLMELRDYGGITRLAGPICSYKGRRISPQGAYRRLRTFLKHHPDIPKITPSSMRHSFATAAVLGGMNIANLSKWLGHTNISTTLNRYVKPLMGDLEQEAVRLDGLYELRKSA